MTIEELTAQLAAAQQQITQLQAREVSFATTEAELAQTRATVAGLNRTIQRQSIEQFIEGLITPGKLAPAFKDMGIVDFMLSLDDRIEIDPERRHAAETAANCMVPGVSRKAPGHGQDEFHQGRNQQPEPGVSSRQGSGARLQDCGKSSPQRLTGFETGGT